MPNYEMQMGSHSQASDTTFKENDQEIIKSGPGYTRDGRPSKYPRSSGRFFYNKNNPAPTATPKSESSPSKPKSFAIWPKSQNPPVKTPPAKKPAAPKPYVKKGGKATGSMKNYAIGSEARRKEYDARGWAYDSTIKRPKTAKLNVSSIKPKTFSIDTKPKASVLTSAPKPKITVSTPKTKSSKIRAKGEAALASGNVKKAQRLRKRYDKVAKKEAKKSKPSSPNTQTYTSTLKLPPGSSAFDARGSYSKLAAKNAANAYSQGNFSLSNTNMTYNKKRNEVSLASAYKVRFK